jgi:hypothetical protein
MQLQIVEQNYGNIALIELPAFFSLVFKRSSKAFEVLGQIRQILAENGQQQAVEDFLGMERDLPVPGGRQGMAEYFNLSTLRVIPYTASLALIAK